MLHHYQTVSKRRISCVGWAEEQPLDWEVLTLLYNINVWLETAPTVYSSTEGRTVYILYENTAFPIDDFIESFSPSLADISRSWPTYAFGTADNQETVRLSAELLPSENKRNPDIEVVQQSISGQKTDFLQTLCLQIECPDHETAVKLYRLFTCMNWRTNIAVMDWNTADFAWVKTRIPFNRGSFFCYISMDPDITPNDCLRSLNFLKKLTLWKVFLKEKLEPAEFEWLSEEIAEGTISNRMEWELALREAMNQLQFRVVNQENSFELFDDAGKRLYFGADCHSAAERALLKILFPLNFH